MENIVSRLQLKDCRLILAIHETGQLALAAEQMAMTQPAASRMLAGIERSIGSRIFTRHPKGMKATIVGEVLARNAATMMSVLEKTFNEVEAVGSGRAGSVRVGAVTGGAVAFVVPAIQKLKQDAAGADLHIDVGPSDVLIEGLLRGDYDFVLSRIPPGTDARQFVVRNGRIEVACYLVRSSHPLAGKKHLSLADLTGCEWVMQDAHSPMRQAIENAFIARQIPLPGEIINTSSLLVMLAYVSSTSAIATISQEVADLLVTEGMGRALSILDVEDQVVVHPYHLITLKSRELNPLAVKLRNLVFAAISDTTTSP